MNSSERKPIVVSLDEMIERNMKFYLYETLAPRTTTFKFYERRVVFPNELIAEYRKKTLDPKFNGVVFNYLDQILYANQINKNFSFHVCKERFTTNHFVFYFKRNHYLVDEINNQIELMLTNGMIQRFRSKYADLKFASPIREYVGPKLLTLEHFNGVFRIFAVCSIIAIIIFLFELISKNQKSVEKVFDIIQ